MRGERSGHATAVSGFRLGANELEAQSRTDFSCHSEVLGFGVVAEDPLF